MNAVTKTASMNTILAIDLGKYKSVACACVEVTGEVASGVSRRRGPSFRVFDNKKNPDVVVLFGHRPGVVAHELLHLFPRNIVQQHFVA